MRARSLDARGGSPPSLLRKKRSGAATPALQLHRRTAPTSGRLQTQMDALDVVVAAVLVVCAVRRAIDAAPP